MKNSIKRAQSQACLGFAERKNFRPLAIDDRIRIKKDGNDYQPVGKKGDKYRRNENKIKIILQLTRFILSLNFVFRYSRSKKLKISWFFARLFVSLQLK